MPESGPGQPGGRPRAERPHDSQLEPLIGGHRGTAVQLEGGRRAGDRRQGDPQQARRGCADQARRGPAATPPAGTPAGPRPARTRPAAAAGLCSTVPLIAVGRPPSSQRHAPVADHAGPGRAGRPSSKRAAGPRATDSCAPRLTGTHCGAVKRVRPGGRGERDRRLVLEVQRRAVVDRDSGRREAQVRRPAVVEHDHGSPRRARSASAAGHRR